MKSFQKMRKRHLPLKAEQIKVMIIITSAMKLTLKDTNDPGRKGNNNDKNDVNISSFQKVTDQLKHVTKQDTRRR